MLLSCRLALHGSIPAGNCSETLLHSQPPLHVTHRLEMQQHSAGSRSGCNWVCAAQSDDDDFEVEEVAAPAAAPAAAGGRARRAVPAKSYVLSDSEDEGDDSDSAESP